MTRIEDEQMSATVEVLAALLVFEPAPVLAQTTAKANHSSQPGLP